MNRRLHHLQGTHGLHRVGAATTAMEVETGASGQYLAVNFLDIFLILYNGCTDASGPEAAPPLVR